MTGGENSRMEEKRQFPWGERIAEARKKLGLTRAELAEKSGLSLMTIRRYERGETAPTLTASEKICAAFGMTVQEFIFESDPLYQAAIARHEEADAAVRREIDRTRPVLHRMIDDISDVVVYKTIFDVVRQLHAYQLLKPPAKPVLIMKDSPEEKKET